jgi:prepilin-type N-terminal cleavage/methylation domain-containing protein
MPPIFPNQFPKPMDSQSSVNHSSRASGFTLVEMLVVIVIMSILMTAGAIGLSGMGGKGVSSGVASVEALFDEARAIAVGQRTRARVLVAKDLDNVPEANLRRVVVAREALKADGSVDTDKWELVSRPLILPDQVYFSQEYSRKDHDSGTGEPEVMGLQGKASTAGDYYYYEFNSEGICTTPGASFVLGTGTRPLNAKPDERPRVTAAGKRDFGGFVVWRNGRTSSFRSPEQISSTISSTKAGDKF